ncbi:MULTISPECIES: hypothetical protein [Vibrio]|uniref:hypothetical protein n=1 Tax=Vibrio TaxID=662 RepID=UPI001C3013FF|nr:MULTISPECIES: hypothetical protein [Vibrio]MCG3724129.1 hypothetical protein [Vibrio cincinnatiensis]MCG3734667.1 hypothetical protein [Vibrio cincinnatiensis]MCG3737855.1 hypothetical protein [Vibrio cincinnatiensis]MCG3741661.1 hypothetical protein [Vibrio cincinnatiensis]MCG3745305.1 hypothetical protein [Vibrio cincinnatiensis]
MNKLERIKNERKKLEIMLLNKSNNCAADEVYQALKPYFDAVDNMNSYHPIGRVRLVRLFLESDLSNDEELFSCYGRFANLVEGVDV